MIPELPKMRLTPWLHAIKSSTQRSNVEFSLRGVLTDSLYYPACGLNGTPVKYLGGNVLSFVYADYVITQEEFLDNLNGERDDCGFLGYQSILQREIFRRDIVPDSWVAPMRPCDPEGIERLCERERRCQPFGHWSVWSRNADRDGTHGPELFSFLYFGGEISALYQGLYCRLRIAPTILAIIQPGGGLGGGWEAIEDDGSFFKRVVASNPAGMPQYLLYGGFGGPNFYTEPPWTEYSGQRIVQLPERYAGLWKLSSR